MILLRFCWVTNSINHPWISERTMWFHVGVGIPGSVGSEHTAVTDWNLPVWILHTCSSNSQVCFWKLTDELCNSYWGSKSRWVTVTQQVSEELKCRSCAPQSGICYTISHGLPIINVVFISFKQKVFLYSDVENSNAAFWHDSPRIHFSK